MSKRQDLHKLKYQDLHKLKMMANLTTSRINWSELSETGAEVIKIRNIYLLFEIIGAGAEPIYVDTFQQRDLEELVNQVYSWTL